MQPKSPVFPSNRQEEIEVAKDQPQYRVLPSVICYPMTEIDVESTISEVVASVVEYYLATRWEAEPGDIPNVRENRKIWLHVKTFGFPMQSYAMVFKEPETKPCVIPPLMPEKNRIVGDIGDEIFLEFELTDENLVNFVESKSVWLFINTHNEPVHPLLMPTEKPYDGEPVIWEGGRLNPDGSGEVKNVETNV